MSIHFDSFTPEKMTRLAKDWQANEDRRREFCRHNREQTEQKLTQLRDERREAGQRHADERRQFMDDLRAEWRQFQGECRSEDNERAQMARDLARDYRSAAEAFHAQRARRA